MPDEKTKITTITDPFGGPRGDIDIPETAPVMAIDNTVIFPHMIAPIIVADDRSKRLVDDAIDGDRVIGLFSKRNDEEGYTGFDQIHSVGTAGVILKMLRMPDGTIRLLVHGLRRVKITERIAETPYLRARIELIREPARDDNETRAMVINAHRLVQVIVGMSHLPEDLGAAVINIKDPGKLSDLITSNLSLDVIEQQVILETADPKVRLRKVLEHLQQEMELLKLGDKIQTKVRTAIDKTQREYMLREQMKAIRQELGESEDGEDEFADLRAAFKDKRRYSESVTEVAIRELNRLEGMSPSSAEFTVSRTYVDWLHELPWMISTEDNLEIPNAKRILNEDHCYLDEVKERILEHLAVLKLKPTMKGPILCFAGPPGVGKTSLGRSIARALNRRFHRLSLGGLHDEAEIRGHRRTYIGAMPGRIIKAIKTCGSNNPVIMLDEIDKVSSDFRGDPSSALLEVLDPEQNFSFHDNYLDLPFDLSKVMFITTANILDTIAPPLRDRMEIIRLSGYTMREKVTIAKQHIIKKQIADNGLKRSQISFDTASIERMIEDYTREAGLRNLEREIGKICRKVARSVATRSRREKTKITDKIVSRYLGTKRFHRGDMVETRAPGVAVGLAWTPHGGDMLAIETAKFPGKGNLVLTGQLGDVMKESAQAALTYLKSNAKRIGIDSQVFQKNDIHLHVPEGAIPKDGPSAGITICTALTSLLKHQRIVSGLAMTGEITLQGTVLPVGGIKEKVLAAHRAGIARVLMPSRNRKDVIDIPKEVRDQIDIKFVSKMTDVLRVALPNGQ